MSRKQHSEEVRQLSALLNAWNPIGGDLPPDEHDCLIDRLLEKLRSGCNEEFVTRFLDQEMRGHFGMDPESCGTVEFAKKIVAWYSDRKRV